MQNKETITDDMSHLPLVVGVDLGGTQIRTAVMRGSTILSRVGLPTGQEPTPENTLPRVYTTLQQALTEAGTSLDQIAGIGIAAPGPLNNRTGIVFAPPNLPGWEGVPLRDIFKEHFHVPVFVENDANAAGLGEYMFGAGRGCKDMVYLTVSTGIGGGVILNGKIMEGANGTAAELGHMTIDLRGERCNCGNTGCLERIASGTAIAQRANEAIRQGEGIELLTFARTMLHHSATVSDPSALPTPPNQEGETIELRFSSTDKDMSDLAPPDKASPPTFDNQKEEEQPLQVNARTVALAAEAGVPLARAIIERAAEGLGVGLVNIIHIFNPEMIILGGGVTQIGSLLMEPALRIVQERAMKAPREAVQIVQAQLGTNVGLIGAGALIYYNN